jgi:hypothetical protein
MKAELAAKADGDDGTHVCGLHEEPPAAFLTSRGER